VTCAVGLGGTTAEPGRPSSGLRPSKRPGNEYRALLRGSGASKAQSAATKAALGDLDGTDSDTVSLMTGFDADELDDLGGLSKWFHVIHWAVVPLPGTRA
jgi:hypothetical protein